MSLTIEQVAKIAFTAYGEVLNEHKHEETPVSWDSLTPEAQAYWTSKAREITHKACPDINDEIFEDDIIKAAEHLFLNTVLTLAKGFLARIL